MGRFGGVLEGIGCPGWEDCHGGGIAVMVIVDCDFVMVKRYGGVRRLVWLLLRIIVVSI